MGFTYRIASPSEYLAITGYGINDVKLAKKAWIAPGQRCTRFDISPANYTFEVQAVSAEKLPFILPAVFTIGPRADDDECLLRYAKLVSRHDVNELVKCVIEGETRVLAASMTMEEIFGGTKSFKQAVFENVQLELNQFGLIIYNANVKQLVDVPGHEYFSYLGHMTQQEAVQAKVDVAEARMKDEDGAKEREGTTRQNAAKDAETKVYTVKRQGEGAKEQARVKAEVKVFENGREAEVAAVDPELAMKKARWEQQARVVEFGAAKAVAIRDPELQVEVERWNAGRQTEKFKTEHLSKAVVGYETKFEEKAQNTAEDGTKQEGRPSKIGEIMESCWRACKLLKSQMLQVVYGNNTTDGQLKQQTKFLSSYSLKALWFGMPVFYASLTHHNSTSTAFSVEDTLFLVAIIVDAALILILPKWGKALVCISWLLLELATCLLILSFNKHYAIAILAALLLAVVVALLQPKLRHVADRHLLPTFTQDMISDEESPHLSHLLDLSQGIASFGGLFTAIAGRFMVGPVNAVGFFFFCAVALGLYLSMVVTVGAVSRPHAKCLAIVVMVLVVLTFIAACIPFVGHSGGKPQVVT